MPDTTTKIRTAERVLFTGKINRLDQIPAYFALAQHSYGNLLGLGLRLSAKTKIDSQSKNTRKVVLLLDRDSSIQDYSISYAFWPDSFTDSLGPEERDAGFNSVFEEISKVFNSDYVEIEGIASPKLGQVNVPIRGGTTPFLLELYRQLDEAKRDSKESDSPQSDQKKADRKFLGHLESIAQISGYFDLVRLGYQRYDSFGLVFSSSKKHPFYVLLENTTKTTRTGPYVITGLWFDEKVKLSEEDLNVNAQRYIAKRIGARLAGAEGKIEGYSNPPESPYLFRFSNPITIDSFFLELLKIDPEVLIEDTQKVKVPEEDKELTPVVKKPEVKLDDEFVKGAERTFDDFFGNK
jgi:hypothetical protein